VAIIGLLTLPGVAHAGGWATVELSSTPDGLKPGATWNVEIDVRQHGRTPMSNVRPTLTITSGDVSRTFASKVTDRAGVYRARVSFPKDGIWRYVIDDGFTGRHSYPAVQVGAGGGPPASDGGGLAYDRLGLTALAGVAAAAIAFLLPRRLRRAVALGG
jgi:hypothetical protein